MEHMRGRVNGETAKQHEAEIRVERHSEKFQCDLTLCVVLLIAVGFPDDSDLLLPAPCSSLLYSIDTSTALITGTLHLYFQPLLPLSGPRRSVAIASGHVRPEHFRTGAATARLQMITPNILETMS